MQRSKMSLIRCQDEASTSLDAQGGGYYAIIRNIPHTFHSKDLRRFFAGMIETEQFVCFHFRHRPEVHQISTSDGRGAENNDQKPSAKRLCCVVRLISASARDKLLSDYHNTHWIRENGDELPLKCFVFKLKLGTATDGGGDEDGARVGNDDNNSAQNADNATDASASSATEHDSASPGEISANSADKSGPAAVLSMADMGQLIELKPPAVMPRGNVGTPTYYFMDLIRNCQLPASVIKKLGLRPLKPVRKFGAVPMEYVGSSNRSRDSSDVLSDRHRSNVSAASTTRQHASDMSIEEGVIRRQAADNDDGSDNDDDQCEEWERHEALHDDVTEHERTKPKLYEDEMEVTWEKGGPGLVWYTDNFYWDQTEQGTDCDWKWTDDWDIDYSVYYKDGDSADYDAREGLDVQRQKQLESGKLHFSAFGQRKREIKNKGRKRRYSFEEKSCNKVGAFEAHTKGVGQKYLKRFGWSPGQSLGRATRQGRPEAVASEMLEDSQLAHDKKGLGFRGMGEKLCRTVQKAEKTHTITTVFDTDRVQDPEDGLLRRNEGKNLKHR